MLTRVQNGVSVMPNETIAEDYEGQSPPQVSVSGVELTSKTPKLGTAL